MKFKVIATDFDGTLCENKWPDIGKPNKEVIRYLKKQRDLGVKIILWTCRVGKLLKNAIDWCYHNGLVFDAINENIPEVVASFGSDTRKIFANEYIDDRMNSRFELPFVEMGKRKKINVWCHELLKNKIYAAMFILLGFLSVPIEWDITFLLFTLMLGLPLFFAQENWVM